MFLLQYTLKTTEMAGPGLTYFVEKQPNKNSRIKWPLLLLHLPGRMRSLRQELLPLDTLDPPSPGSARISSSPNPIETRFSLPTARLLCRAWPCWKWSICQDSLEFRARRDESNTSSLEASPENWACGVRWSYETNKSTSHAEMEASYTLCKRFQDVFPSSCHTHC